MGTIHLMKKAKNPYSPVKGHTTVILPYIFKYSNTVPETKIVPIRF